VVPPTNVFYQMKSRDTFAPIGPYIVTADEIKDPLRPRPPFPRKTSRCDCPPARSTAPSAPNRPDSVRFRGNSQRIIYPLHYSFWPLGH
jgi:2-keto-4-pentenoate hydratase/2-oxohepta-3-ene-1,7-dioic acid hydratase in catechol pathway